MRPSDLLILPIAALWQQKVRTILTTLGVIFGAFVLAASLSIGEGVQETIDRETRRNDVSRRVDIFPKWNFAVSKSESDIVKVEGTMTEARRDRLRKSLAHRKQQTNRAQVRTELTRSVLDKLAAIPHVNQTIPFVYNNGFILFGDKSEGTQVFSSRPDQQGVRQQIVAGRFFDAPNQRGMVISETLAYRLGFTNEADLEGLIGKPLRLEFRSQKVEPGFMIYLMKPRESVSRDELAALAKIKARLPDALENLGLSKSEADALRSGLDGTNATEPEVFTEELPVVGVIRQPSEEELKSASIPYRFDADVLLPYQTATDLYFHGPNPPDQGVNQAVLLVDEEKYVKDVVKEVLTIGVDARAPIEFIERERLMYLLIFSGMTCVAGVALLVSALGITNTMLMSVLERTREIGIMKAVGADNRHLQFIFLVEGGLIGFFGGVVGLVLAWAASFPADSWVRSMVMRDMKIDLKGSIFVFPTWISLTVLAFTVVVTTVAALYPARHAARIDPVKALRHE